MFRLTTQVVYLDCIDLNLSRGYTIISDTSFEIYPFFQFLFLFLSRIIEYKSNYSFLFSQLESADTLDQYNRYNIIQSGIKNNNNWEFLLNSKNFNQYWDTRICYY